MPMFDRYKLEEVRSYVSDSSDYCSSTGAANCSTDLQSPANPPRAYSFAGRCNLRPGANAGLAENTDARTEKTENAGGGLLQPAEDPRKGAFSLGSKTLFQRSFAKSHSRPRLTHNDRLRTLWKFLLGVEYVVFSAEYTLAQEPTAYKIIFSDFEYYVIAIFRVSHQPAPARNHQHGIPDRRLIPSRSNCFNCGGVSHHTRQCPSLTVQLSALEHSQAREQINALSIYLRDSQAAYEQSEARVSALVKRNEELASSAFGQPSQSSLQSPHNLPEFVIAAPLPDCSAVTVAHAIMTECILKFGVMTQLVSDNASYFKGEVVSEIEGSLAFGGSSQSFCNEDASSPKGYGRERDRGAARRLARREQSPVRDEEFLPRPEVLAGSHSDVDVESVEKTPSGRHDTVTLPPIFDRIRPVLYQVVSTGWGSGVILEAEDLFTVGRDRRDLHCIILDQHAVNVLSSYRGFDKSMVSVKDYV
ncbi:hypothetical protein RB195_008146 [Necator americanus]|uniref:CCHC-type domain-containing protein n=1 Tax=Necator americanus TaxID=51031 RepID=A0ABR1CMA6_NECAM